MSNKYSSDFPSIVSFDYSSGIFLGTAKPERMHLVCSWHWQMADDTCSTLHRYQVQQAMTSLRAAAPPVAKHATSHFRHELT
jgi:hypothetical protein